MEIQEIIADNLFLRISNFSRILILQKHKNKT